MTHSQLEEQPAVPVGSLLGDLDGFAQQGLGRIHGILQHKHPQLTQILGFLRFWDRPAFKFLG